jgi:hypothetical protein
MTRDPGAPTRRSEPSSTDGEWPPRQHPWPRGRSSGWLDVASHHPQRKVGKLAWGRPHESNPDYDKASADRQERKG